MIYDKVVVEYKNGRVKEFTFDVSTYEGVAKRDSFITKSRKSKTVDTVDWIINSHLR